MPKSNNADSIALPPPSFHKCWSVGRARAAANAAVVFTVNIVVPLPPEASGTLVGFSEQVGRLCAFAGELAGVQVKVIVPE